MNKEHGIAQKYCAAAGNAHLQLLGGFGVGQHNFVALTVCTQRARLLTKRTARCRNYTKTSELHAPAVVWIVASLCM